MHTRTAAAAITAALLLAGCSSASDKAATTDKPKGSTKPTNTPTAVNPAGPMEFGKTSRWSRDGEEGASGNTTVLSYRQPVPNVEPPGTSGESGEEWGALEVKVCVKTGDGVRVSQQPWSVAFEDGARVSPTGLNGGDFPRPEFPQDAPVPAGDCVRGLIMLPVPKGKRPERVIYGPDGVAPAQWKIPPK